VDGRAGTGVRGEDAAAALYERRGYRVVARNWRCAIGELDLVVARGELLVFCEVKARGGTRFGGGFDAVTMRKQRKVRAVAEAFLLATRARPQRTRFDVASVMVAGARASPSIELFEDAF